MGVAGSRKLAFFIEANVTVKAEWRAEPGVCKLRAHTRDQSECLYLFILGSWFAAPQSVSSVYGVGGVIVLFALSTHTFIRIERVCLSVDIEEVNPCQEATTANNIPVINDGGRWVWAGLGWLWRRKFLIFHRVSWVQVGNMHRGVIKGMVEKTIGWKGGLGWTMYVAERRKHGWHTFAVEIIKFYWIYLLDTVRRENCL